MAKKRAATRRLHFTEKRLATLESSVKLLVYDLRVDGLGLKVEASGRKTYFWWRSVAGKPLWKSIGDCSAVSLDAARAKAQEFNHLLAEWKKDGGPNPFETERRGVPVFHDLVESYIENRIHEHSLNPERAEHEVRLMVRKYLDSWLDRPLNQITVEDVLAAKRACGKGRYAARAIVGLVRTLFNWSAGTRDGKLNFWKVGNPAVDVSLPKKEKRRRFLQPGELVRFNKELEKEEHAVLRDVLTLLLATGARKGNLYAMRWADISFELKKWTIPMSKSGEGYEVSLTRAALEVLERRRREIAETEPFVFPARGASGHITDVKKRWIEFRKRCGFPDVRLHDIRRTRGSYLAISGVSLQQIGAALGHKSLGSTEIYAQLHDEAIAKALETGDRTMGRMTDEARKRIESKRPAQLPA